MDYSFLANVHACLEKVLCHVKEIHANVSRDTKDNSRMIVRTIVKSNVTTKKVIGA